LLLNAFLSDPIFEVVGEAVNPIDAMEIIAKKRPDVITLDIEMPQMDGLTFLKKLMREDPIPVIVVSTLAGRGSYVTLEALRLGAIDFHTKESTYDGRPFEVTLPGLLNKVKMAAAVNLKNQKNMTSVDGNVAVGSINLKKVVCIGASTGGIEAICSILAKFPINMPPILITQHIPPGFSESLVKIFQEHTVLKVLLAKSGTPILPGHIYVAQALEHLGISKNNNILVLTCRSGAKVSGHNPSVDEMFRSVYDILGAKCIPVLLTGMGFDGARGLIKLKEVGAPTIAQGEKSSIIWGMPKVAIQNGGAVFVSELNEVPNRILQSLRE
jgi:two-component system chemotaxis response regulator CheB